MLCRRYHHSNWPVCSVVSNKPISHAYVHVWAINCYCRVIDRWYQGFDWEGLRVQSTTPPIVPKVLRDYLTLCRQKTGWAMQTFPLSCVTVTVASGNRPCALCRYRSHHLLSSAWTLILLSSVVHGQVDLDTAVVFIGVARILSGVHFFFSRRPQKNKLKLPK